MELSYNNIYMLLSCLICLIVLFNFFLVKKENKKLEILLTEANAGLEITRKRLSDLQRRHNEIIEFQNSIQHAELTTKLQTPRLRGDGQDVNHVYHSNTPEKYKYIRSLSDKGMSPEEIGAVLSISPQEANQLVSLSKLAA